MARTKKQTLENASERKRQIQEEILKETEIKKKKEDFSIHPREFLSCANLKALHSMKIKVTDCDLKGEVSCNGAHPVINSPIKGGEDLPKAVIFISDIRRSQLKPCVIQEDGIGPADSKECAPLETNLKGNTPTVPVVLDKTQSQGSLKGGPKSPRMPGSKKNAHSASLETLKAVSEKVREEKSKKGKNYFGLSNSDSVSVCSTIPAQSSPSDTHYVQPKTPEASEEEDPNFTAEDKPKVNIFTENQGVDLGKRIRSPRRLSEDMIALPIFSARRWNNSPRETSLVGKSFEEFSPQTAISSSKSLYQSESFKSPVTSPASNKKCVSSPKTPPIPAVPPSLEQTTPSLKNKHTCQADVKSDGSLSLVLSQKQIIKENEVERLEEEKKPALAKFTENEQSKEGARPHPSLLCAMLIGGTEVADNYSQDRVKYKSQAPDSTDVNGLLPAVNATNQLEASDAHFSEAANVSERVSEEKTDSVTVNHSVGSSEVITTNCDSPKAQESDCDIGEKNDSEPSVNSLDKKKPLDLSSKLKQLNEDVLKLLEQDLEVEIVNCQTSGVEDLLSSGDNAPTDENSLYRLISDLGSRLSDAKYSELLSTPVDQEFVKNLLQSCPKTSLGVRAKLNTIARQEEHQKKMKEQLVNVNAPGVVSDKNNGEKISEPMSDSSDVVTVSPVPSGIHELRSSDSLSELDSQAITLAATSAIQQSYIEDDKRPPNSSEQSLALFKQEVDADIPTSERESVKSEVREEMGTSELAEGNKQNSSVSQACSKLSPAVSTTSTLNCNKENQVKSKLGSKIPVPGSSHSYRTSKKTWRQPRTVLEPKPLSILSELEEISTEPKNIFTCPNLQKYLSVPSNRVIVPSEKHQDMEAADALAKEDEERASDIRVKEEVMQPDYDDHLFASSGNDPDFDEVDCILFISFSNEVELKAHIRVDKILDWDRDDTMLRISRARAFEEAKAHNQDMGQYKLKHLRGQHMRWKKYRKLFNDEVNRILDIKEDASLQAPENLKKTADKTKIKGWSKRAASHDGMDRKKNISAEGIELCNTMSPLESSFNCDTNQSALLTDGQSPVACPKKSHKQLFRELNLNWEDRMIHRKLGGLSLKGCRKSYPGGSRKTQVTQPCKDLNVTETICVKDPSMDVSSLSEKDFVAVPKLNDSSDSVHKLIGADVLEEKKSLPLTFPMLTERMAISALTALAFQDGQVCSRKKIKRLKQEPMPSSGPNTITKPFDSSSLTPLSMKYFSPKIVSSPASPLSHLSQASTVNSSSLSTATTPLVMEFKEEPVSEGVDIAAYGVSSPSIADSSSVKSCSKPGCRYGCICHLCSVDDVSAPASSPKSKSVSAYCEKEYCRLGCICDSIDPEKPMSCHSDRQILLLQPSHTYIGCHDDSEDIPYLPSLKKRPKLGERFSNLPQRERTHRASKNLDAITRKALMLYETSEIYCEKVERIRKKPEISSGTTVVPMVSPSQSQSSPTEMEYKSPTSSSKNEFEICSEFAEEDDSYISFPDSCSTKTLENSDLNYSDVQPKNTSQFSRSTVEIDEVRRIVPNMEPSAHKRKRKSHPLSGEIFSASTCARAQPFKNHIPAKDKLLTNKSGQPSLQSNTDAEKLNSDINECQQNTAETDSIDIENNTEPTKMLPEPVNTLTSQKELPEAKHDPLSAKELPNTTVENSSRAECEPSGTSCKPAEPVTPVDNPSPVSYSFKTAGTKQLSHSASLTSNSYFGSTRQHHGWHTSMVCLKARAAPRPNNFSEDDVQEEDEVKLLEFAANCNWEGAKKEILGKVAQCLTRGQYPQPRTMNVCEFVVEILPKAHQPSVIPRELRTKLPDQMFSIRVRITRREQLKKESVDGNHSFIDLSGTSPVKKSEEVCLRIPLTKDRFPSSSRKQPFLCTGSSDPVTSSSMGISGLTNLCFSTSPFHKHPNSNTVCRTEVLLKSNPAVKSAAAPDTPTSRNKPILNTIACANKQDLSQSTSSTQTLKSVKSKGLFMKLGTDPGAKPNFVDAVNNTQGTSSQGTKCSINKQVPHVVFSTNDVKYVKLPGKEGVVEVIVDPPTGKKLLALPLSLTKGKMVKGKHGTIINLPIYGGTQNKVLPLSSIKLPVQQQDVTDLKTNPESGKLQNALPVGSGPDSKKLTKSSPIKKSDNVKEEMIMIFDAAHVRASQESKQAQKLLVKSVCPGVTSKQTSRVVSTKPSTAVSSSLFKPIVEVELKGKKLEQVAVVKNTDGCEKLVAKPTSFVKLEYEPQKTLPNNCTTASISPSGPFAETPQAGSKRNLTPQALEGSDSQQSKRRSLAADTLMTVDEDSNVSAHSGSEIPAAASPVSLVDRPKSVMSTSISTASTDDFLFCDSEDEIDVGEDDHLYDRTDCTSQKDVGNSSSDYAYSKDWKELSSSDLRIRPSRMRKNPSDRILSKLVKKSLDKPQNKLEHHNQLERMRRSKLRTLFDELQQQVLRETGLPVDHVMSKANVLIEAKKVILRLNKDVKKGDHQRHLCEQRNKDLKETLSSLLCASKAGSAPPTGVSEAGIAPTTRDVSKTGNAPTTTDASTAGSAPTITEQPTLPQEQSSSLLFSQDDMDTSETVDLISESSEEDKSPEGAALEDFCDSDGMQL
ncbi:hypothetical protein Btru_071075 [Bulinus truncatus]|nr:hypothetical protein Btru_071075 [Bulinus truncatus]